MKKVILGIALLAATATLWTSCKKDEKSVAPPEPGNEFLTTVKLVATNANDPSDVQTASWKDLNPDDLTPPDTSLAKLNLHANAVYNVQVQFWDDSKTPSAAITPEIQERANYHLICFDMDGNLNLTVQRTDQDTNNPPLEIGLQDKFTTGAASSGNLNVQLRHQPNVKNGSCDPGSTDADVNFHINIQ
ncbi:hypothetical protein [Taibaiella koreensis]|uniref:hypothetical protein n=1 Tax=Taibaiella koreensis TaxID=1268548 RepID=UPI000E599B36|nr:hypothetical protein [Taibaiella koreensis]